MALNEIKIDAVFENDDDDPDYIPSSETSSGNLL